MVCSEVDIVDELGEELGRLLTTLGAWATLATGAAHATWTVILLLLTLHGHGLLGHVPLLAD